MVLYLFPKRDRQDFAPALETNDKRSSSFSLRKITTNATTVLVVEYTLYKRIFW